jgi:hypothetical protein
LATGVDVISAVGTPKVSLAEEILILENIVFDLFGGGILMSILLLVVAHTEHFLFLSQIEFIKL